MAWRLGLLLGLELWISTEIVALLPDHRKRLAGSVIPTTGAFALAVLLGAPLLYYAWVGSHPSGYGIAAVNWTGRPARSAFFTQRLYERCIPKGETVAIFPFGRWGDSMLWQAESGFSFTMAEGNMGRDNYPPQFVFDPIVSKLQFQVTNTVHLPESELRSFATTHHGERIVSMAGGYPDHEDLSRLGSVSSVGGVLVAPACGQPALGNQAS